MQTKLSNDNGLQDWKTEHQAVITCNRFVILIFEINRIVDADIRS